MVMGTNYYIRNRNGIKEELIHIGKRSNDEFLSGVDTRGFHYDHTTKKIYHLSCWTQQQTKTEGVKA